MIGRPWDHPRYCAAVDAEIARFADVVRDVDVARQVLTCPDWTIGELITHAGGVHRWAGAMVGDLAERRYRRSEMDLGLPERTEDYAEWLAAGGPPLVAALRAADPDAPMWVWGPDPHVRWWARRMLHETTVHRADAELTLGRTPDIDADVAADGVEEFFDNLSSAASFSPDIDKLRGGGEIIGLSASDGVASWLITVGPDGPTLRRGEDASVSVATSAAVRASLADLLLFVWGRRRPGEAGIEVSGDPALLTWWLQHSAVG